MKKSYLAIDIGASSGRGIIGSFDGNKLILSESNRFSNSLIIVNGSYYWDVAKLFNNIKYTIQINAQSVDSVGLDSWGVDCGYIGYDGKLLKMPYSYRDPRITKTPDKVHTKIPWERYYLLTGIQYIASNTIYQIYEDLISNPDVLDNIDKVLLIPDLFNYFLTDILANEYTITSTSGLLDVYRRDFSREILESLSIPDRLFSEIAIPGRRLGKLSRTIQKEIGVKALDVINVGEHDPSSAILAIPQNANDYIYISSGTWSLMGILSDKPIINEKALRYNFTNEGGSFNKYRVLKNIMGLGLIHECRRIWEKEGDRYSYNTLENMANGCIKFKYLIDPADTIFMSAENVPLLIENYCTKTAQGRLVSRGEIVRCIYDSIALSYKQCALMLSEIAGTAFNHIHIVGGGSNDSLLCQLTADVTGMMVYAGPKEASAAGNALMQAYANGEMASEADIKEVAKRSFDVKVYEPAIELAEVTVEAYNRFINLKKK